MPIARLNPAGIFVLSCCQYTYTYIASMYGEGKSMTKENDGPGDNIRIGRRMIEAALKMEDNLAELLSVQIMHIKQLAAKDLNQEIVNANNLLRNIIFSLMLTEERIARGLELCEIKTNINYSKPSWLATHRKEEPD